MRRILVAATIGIATLVAPTTSGAAAPDVIHGGCGFDTDQQATVTGGQNVGVIFDLSATTTGDIPPTPTDATVTCSILVDGVEAPGTRYSYSGYGAQAGVDRISFTAGGGDWVAICQSVTFADGTTQTQCPPWQDQNLPPQWLIDLINNAFFAVDAVACPELVLLAGSYGPVTIAPDGDVYVPDPLGLSLNPVYDCPPYNF